ncbi:MAG: tryptophan-rich sensory protein [Candidatus Staskawiczbacteria bacterium]|nr:tryptophan-rich sensory protein [Candidatus Staskawiczbacteria bacterium]
MAINYSKLYKLLISIIICEFAGVVGSFYTIPEINGWYKNLNKSSLNPPGWIFGPVWTTLFVLMGISLYLVWSKKFVVKNELKRKNRKPWNKFSQKLLSGSWQKANIILIFATQLILNILWSAIFFGMHSPGAAFFELLMLWFAIIFTIINFYRASKVAALLLLPYILWVSFAGILTYFVWILN